MPKKDRLLLTPTFLRLRKRAGLRLICLILVGTFSVSELSYAAPVESGAFTKPVLSLFTRLVNDPFTFEVPAEFCKLHEIYKAVESRESRVESESSSSRLTTPAKKTAGRHDPRLIIHIQDPHSNFGGQMNLANTVDSIMSKYKVSLVLVEGGSKDDTLTPIKEVAPPDVWKKVAKSFLMEGKISGEEYLNLTSDHPMRILGIEDKALYMDSLRAYADLAAKRAATLE